MSTATTARPEPVLTPVDREDYIATARMTFDEWIDWDYEGGLTEWLDGEVHVYMSVFYPHDTISGFLRMLIGLFVETTDAGTVHTAPYALKVSSRRGREPDLMFVSTHNEETSGYKFADGPVDLVVEVVSEDSVTRDNRDKFREYESAGVREYWIIDSRPGRRIARFYLLDEGRYLEMLPDESGIYRSTVLAGFWLDLTWLWQSKPKATSAWAEIVPTLAAKYPG